MEVLNRMKKNRIASFFLVFIVYLIAGAVGVAVYLNLSFSWWLNLLIADIAATVITFIFSLIFNNASVYDPYWSVQPLVILIGFALTAQLNLVRLLLLVAVSLWGIRLTVNWGYNFYNFDYQDWRYTMLHEKTGALYPVVNFGGIHMVPTLIVYFCVLPAAFAFKNDAQWNLGTVLFFCLSVAATAMQGIADMQMHKFRKNRTGRFIRNGLWKYSRHPNYLGEILMWWGVALAVVCAFPDKWYLCTGAALNTVLFLCASIPMADKRQSAKPGFEIYKKETRMLLPIKK